MKQVSRLKRMLRQLLLFVCIFLPFANAYAGNADVITTNTANATVSFTNIDSYGWAWNSTTNKLQSNNYRVNSSTAEMRISIELPSSCTFSFDYAVSSEQGYDELTIELDENTIVDGIGGEFSSSFSQKLDAGSHSLILLYKKDSSDSEGSDRAYVSNMKFVGKSKIAWGACGDNTSYSVYNDGSLIISGTGAMADYAMSLSPLYNYRDQISSITVEEGVTTLGRHAFYWLQKATGISLPSTLTSIEEGALIACKGLTSITIPQAVKNIGNSAFQNCTGLTSITIPENVATLGYAVFKGCTNLKTVTYNAKNCSAKVDGLGYIFPSTVNSVTIGEKVNKLPNGLLWETSITSIAIPNSVVTIEEDVFTSCEKLTNISFGTGLKTLATQRWCTSLVSVEIPEGVTNFGGFTNCSMLKTLKIPTTLNTVDGGYLVYQCGSFERLYISSIEKWVALLSNGKVIIPSCKINLGSGLLTNLNIPSTITSIPDRCFANWASLTSVIIPNTINSIGEQAFSGTSITSVNIPNSVSSLSKWLFADCSQLQAINIPGSVTSIGDCVFSHCTSLQEINCDIETPLALTADAVTGVDKTTCVIRVPQGCVDAYRSAPVWGDFANIDVLSDDIASGTCGEELTWKLTRDGVLVISGTGGMTNYGYQTTPWYSYANSITNVELASGITRIGNYAFQNCSNLKLIEIPNTITSIGNLAFFQCAGLTSVEIPSSVTSISDQAFSYCSGLTSVSIPNSIKSIGMGVFQYCSSLVSISIPNSVTSIGSSAFSNCTGLTSIEIPSSVAHIGSFAFGNCPSLVSVTNNATTPQTISNNTFTSYGTLYVPQASISAYQQADYWKNFTVKSIVASGTCGTNLTWTLDNEGLLAIEGRGAMKNYSNSSGLEAPWYAYRSSIKSVSIGNDVTSIGEHAFHSCSNLTSVVIPSSVTRIGWSAFNSCSNLTSVTIPENVTTIENYAFYGCSKLVEVTNMSATPQSISAETFSNYSCTLIVPKESVSAYQNANYWKDFTIKPIVTVIASGTCGDNLTWTLDNEGLLTIEGSGNMYDYNTSGSAPWYNNVSSITSLAIGDNVTSIGNFAFADCAALTSVEIRNNVTIIGWFAFYECSTLTSVEIPNSVTSIGSDAFDSCVSLISVVIPNSVTNIGEGAFDSCSNLTSVEIGNSVTCIENYTFWGCASLTSIVIPNSVTSIGEQAFQSCYNLISIEIGNSVTNIDGSAFSGCSSLTSINVGANNAFYSSLEGVLFNKSKTMLIYYPGGKQGEYTIPNSVTSISESAFARSSGLTSVSIPNSVTSIGNNAFYNCTNLNEVTNLATTPQTISYDTFSKYGTLYVPAAAAETYAKADYWKNFTIIGVENGDVNLDQKVNVTDAVEVIYNVVGNPSANFVKIWSDVNSDDQYTIADAMAVNNVILGEEIGTSSAKGPNRAEATPDVLAFTRVDDNTLALTMDNTMAYSAFQFELTLPEGMSLENVTLNQNRCQNFSMMYRETGENKYTVAVYNFGNEPFATGTGNMLYMTTSGYGDSSEIEMTDIHFSTIRAVDVQFGNLSLSDATGVESVDINVNNQNAPVYDLQGRRLNGTQRGVNIVNGKKIIIK